MRHITARKLAMTLAIAALALAGPAHAVFFNYTVGGWSHQFPAPTTPPAGAPWGPEGYPGDTVEFMTYDDGFELEVGSHTQKINTLAWTIDYTYGGTATDPNAWSDVHFDFTAPRAISWDGGSSSLAQDGHLACTWDNDFLSLLNGSTTTLYVPGFRIDVTPLRR